MLQTLFDEERPTAPPIVLRPYQRKALQAFHAARDRNVHRMLMVLPTGTGKTSVFSELVKEQSEDPAFTALVLAHRKELLEQGAERIRLQNPSLRVEIESGESKAQRGADVVVAGVQSVGGTGNEKLDWLRPTLVICDEAHHAAADTYQNVFRRMGCYDKESGVDLLGVTATPHRLDNKALHGSQEAIFEEIIFQYTLRDAITDGYLVDLKGYRVAADINLDGVKSTGGDYNQKQLEQVMNTEPLNELAFKSWSEAAGDQRTVVFCAGVSHAQRLAEIFREHGVKAESVDGTMNKVIRDAIMRRFRSGETQVLTNVEICTEGVDIPECSCVLLLRPTQSWALFCQMVGRGLRVLPGLIDGVDESEARRRAIAASRKAVCTVIDVVDNTDAHSLTKAPKQGTVPSLNEMVGLPSMLDLEGRTLLEASEEFEELPDTVKAAAFRRPTKFSGLTAKLTAIDMIGEVAQADEAVKANARLLWLKMGDLHYMVPCAFGGNESDRQAHMVGDILGKWRLHLVSQVRDQWFDLPDDQLRAFPAAEHIIRTNFFGVARFADARAQWRGGDITDKQKNALRTLGVDEDAILAIPDRGTASALIERIRMESGR